MARYRQSGPIRFGEVVEYFGGTAGTPYNLSDYYKGGGIVPATGPNGGQAAIHTIAVDPTADSDAGAVPEEFFIFLDGNSRNITFDVAIDSSQFEGIATTTENQPGPFRARASVGRFGNAFGLLFDFETITDQLQTDVETYFGISRSTQTQTIDPPEAFSVYITNGLGVELSTGSALATNVFVSSTRIGIVYQNTTDNDFFTQLTAMFEVNEIVTWQFLNADPMITAIPTVNVGIPVANMPETEEHIPIILSDNLTTPTQLRDDLVTRLQANATISGLRTISAGTVDADILARIQNNGIHWFYRQAGYSSTGTVTNGWAFTDYTGSDVNTAASNPIAVPTTRPTSSRIVIEFGSFERPQEELPFVYPGFDFSQQTIMDVSALGRRLIFETSSYTGSYLIDSVGISGDVQLLEVSDVRDVNTAEQTLLDAGRSNTLYVVAEINPHSVEIGDPVTFLTERDTDTFERFFIDFDSGSGNLLGSTAGTHHPRSTSVTSEIRLALGDGVNPETTDIVLGQQDSQGITNELANVFNSSGEFYVTTGTNSVRIEDSRQRTRLLPTITITEDGTARLQASDFTVTEVQPGIPTTRTTDYLTIEYSTDDVSATTTGWNFQSSITGPTTTFTTWPSTGDIFLHVGLSDVVLDDLETTLD